jgi:hypothetical protein
MFLNFVAVEGGSSFYNSITAFWNAMSCSLVDRYRCLKEVCCLLFIILAWKMQKNKGTGQEKEDRNRSCFSKNQVPITQIHGLIQLVTIFNRTVDNESGRTVKEAAVVGGVTDSIHHFQTTRVHDKSNSNKRNYVAVSMVTPHTPLLHAVNMICILLYALKLARKQLQELPLTGLGQCKISDFSHKALLW